MVSKTFIERLKEGEKMISVNPEGLSERENYKFLTGSIIPRPVALVTTQSETGVFNIAPFSFFNIVSSNPPMISVSVQRKKECQKILHEMRLKPVNLLFT